MKMRQSVIVLTALLASLATPARSVPPDNPNPYAPLNYKPMGNLGQALVDMEMVKHPEVKLFALHMTPIGVDPKSDKDRFMLCTSVGRIGKHDDPDDIDVFVSGKEFVEWDKKPFARQNPWQPQAAPKYDMVVPLYVKSGEMVGLATIVFPWKEGDDIQKDRKIAFDIIDEIKGRVATKDDFLKPAP